MLPAPVRDEPRSGLRGFDVQGQPSDGPIASAAICRAHPGLPVPRSSNLAGTLMLREWSDVYLIGIEEIDRQHQGFFTASHRLYEAILDREGREGVIEAVAFMRDYAESHFDTEEAFMRRHAYPDLADHLRQHVAFMRHLDDLENDLRTFGPSQELADRALEMTQDWLIDHIADEDVLYALHVKAGELGDQAG
jgi:hemerythrin